MLLFSSFFRLLWSYCCINSRWCFTFTSVETNTSSFFFTKVALSIICRTHLEICALIHIFVVHLCCHYEQSCVLIDPLGFILALCCNLLTFCSNFSSSSKFLSSYYCQRNIICSVLFTAKLDCDNNVDCKLRFWNTILHWLRTYSP